MTGDRRNTASRRKWSGGVRGEPDWRAETAITHDSDGGSGRFHAFWRDIDHNARKRRIWSAPSDVMVVFPALSNVMVVVPALSREMAAGVSTPGARAPTASLLPVSPVAHSG